MDTTRTAARRAGILLAICLLAAGPPAQAEDDPGYVWMSESGDGNASLVYGSPETAEDLVFILTCRNGETVSDLTVYVDIPDTEVGDPVEVALVAGEAKLAVPGAISTDEMSGFHFAVAESFAAKPMIDLLRQKGEVTVKTGSVTTALPETGRAAELANFTKTCALD